MYEELIQFLLGKKEEFTEDDLDEFIDLLNKALDIVDEYDICRKQTIIENIITKADILDEDEAEAVSTALNNLLADKGPSSADLFDEQSAEDIPLRERRFRRGRGGKVAEKLDNLPSDPSDTDEDPKPVRKTLNIGGSKKKARTDKTEADTEDTDRASQTALESHGKQLHRPGQQLPAQNTQRDENHPVSFSKLFGTIPASTSETVSRPIKNNSAVPEETRGVSAQFEFEIGELEENHNEGPEYHFGLDDISE